MNDAEMPTRHDVAAMPDGPSPHGQPVRPRKKRRWPKRIGIALAILLGIVGLGSGWLHTSMGQDFVRQRVVEAVTPRMGGGSFELGRLEFTLFGDVALGDVRVTSPDGRTTTDIEKVDVALDWTSLLSEPVVVENVSISGVRTRVAGLPKEPSSEKTGPPPPPPPDKALSLQSLDVSDFEIEVTQPDGTEVVISDIGVGLALKADPAKRHLTLDKAALSVAGVNVKRSDGTTLRLSPFKTQAKALVRGDEIAASWRGINTTVHVQRPGAEPLDIPVTLEGAEVKRNEAGIRFLLKQVIAGAVRLDAIRTDLNVVNTLLSGEQKLEVEGLKLTAKQLNALLGQKALLSDVNVRFVAKGPPNKLVLDGAVESRAGPLRLTGQLDLSDPLHPKYRLNISAPKIEPGLLLAGDFPPTTTSLNVTVAGQGLRPKDLDTRVAVDIGETQVGTRKVEGVSLKAHAKGGTVTLNDFSVSVLGHRVKLDGSFDPESRTVVGRFTTNADLERLIKRIDEAGVFKAPLPPLKGQDVSIDLKLRALLKDMEGDPTATQMPAQKATLSGQIRGSNLDDGRVKVGRLQIDVDLRVDNAQPGGNVRVAIDDMVLPGGLTVRHLRGKTTFDGNRYAVTLTATEPRTEQHFEIVLKGEVDPETRNVSMELSKVLAKLGRFQASLAEPVALSLPPGMDVLGQRVGLPRTTFRVAGGTVAVRAQALLNPSTPIRADKIYADVTLSDVNLRRLPKMLRRKLRGLGGRINGSVTVRGNPLDPAVTFSVRTGLKGFGVVARGGILDRRMDAELQVTRRGRTVLEADVSAPLLLPPPDSGRKPGLNPRGELRASVLIPPKTRVLDLLPKAPSGVRKTLEKATLDLTMTTKGSAARPRVAMSATLSGVSVKPLGVTLGGNMDFALKPEGRHHRATGSLRLQDVTGRLPAFGGTMSATFKRSVVTARDKRPDEARIELFDADLAQLVRSLPLPPATRDMLTGLAGSLGGVVTLRKDGPKLLAVRANHVIKGLALPGFLSAIDASMNLGIDRKGIHLVNRIDDGRPGDLGAFRFSILRSPLKLLGLVARGNITELLKTPFSLRLDLPKVKGARFHQLSPHIPALPGHISGALHVGGSFNAPTVSGALDYEGFQTMSGTLGRLAGKISTQGKRYTVTASLGAPGKSLSAAYTFDGSQVFDFYLGAVEELWTTLRITSPDVDLKQVLPRVPGIDVEALKFEGQLESDLAVEVGLGYDDDFQLIPLVPRGSGSLRFSRGRLALPGSPRVFHDIGLNLGLDGGLQLHQLVVQESDEDVQGRRLELKGSVPLSKKGLGTGRFKLTMKDFLAVAMFPDSPEGALTMKATLTAENLGRKGTKLGVDIAALDLHRPSRFIRDHYQQMTHLGDLFYLKDGHTKGTLPVIPPNPVLGIDVPDPSEVIADVAVRFPKKATILNFPLAFKMTGGINLQLGMGPSGQPRVKMGCDVRFFDGTAMVMGQPFKLERGGMHCPGPVRDFAATFLFSKALPDPMRREQSQASAAGPATFKIVVTPKGLPETYPGGASGHYLIDAFSVLNAGRSRMGSEPGHPPSSTVQWPGGDEQPMVLTFLKTNLAHLVFLTRTNLWAPSGDLFEEYGHLRNMEGDAYWDQDRSRIRLLGQEPRTASSAALIRYDRLLARDARTIFGVGAFAGSNPGVGAEFFVEWASEN